MWMSPCKARSSPRGSPTRGPCLIPRCTDAAPPHRRDNSNHRNGTQAQTATDDAADVGSTSRILPAMPPPTPFPKSAHATASGSARKLTKQKINTDFSLPSETPASSIYSER
nr:PREDICTED: uncharacterized protein LOC107398227 [Tribolium castaneum]|eukprot:XP_015837082.1 PREDICTED: uncharacterized protein LOC107398227 [Tribolium castaneum]